MHASMNQTQAKSLAPEVKNKQTCYQILMLTRFAAPTLYTPIGVYTVQIALWAIPPLRVNRYLCEVHRVRTSTGYTNSNTIPSG